MALPSGPMEIVFFFDATSRMYACLDEFRGRAQDIK